MNAAARGGPRERVAFVVVSDAALLALAFALSALLRFEFAIPAAYLALLGPFLALALSVQLGVFWAAGVYRALHRYAGLADLLRLAGAMGAGTWLVGALGEGLSAGGVFPARVPFSVLGIDFFIGTAFAGALRLYLRTRAAAGAAPAGSRRRTLIVGAGDAGSLVRRHLQSTGAHELVGFVDDAPGMRGRVLDGVPIAGTLDDLPRLIDELRLEEVVFGIPSAPGELVRKAFHSCRERVAFRTVPGLLEVLSGGDPTALRDVRVEDLLRREPVKLDDGSVRGFLHGRVVLVSGAGGSIGSELVRQVAALDPARLVLLERYENNLYEVHHELVGRHPSLALVPVVGDIADRGLLDRVFGRERPRVVFHAAAHKHVPLMEANALEAIRNNVFGTLSLAEAAERHGVERFVLISTDKAVRPRSVMGCTKRVAELIAQTHDGRGGTRFVTVRFGNVLNSAGSVVPLFTRQIREGGPVTVTDPAMRRYFMTIPEASALVIQAGSQGQGGEIFVLDMGEPVRILDLARDLIVLSGLRPDVDVRIQFIGARPGEKLDEELLEAGETEQPTVHPKIRIARAPGVEGKVLARALERLADSLERGETAEALVALAELVPEFSASRPI